jgi:hypothetical protein
MCCVSKNKTKCLCDANFLFQDSLEGMLIELPVDIRTWFTIKPEYLHEPTLKDQISQQFFLLLDEFYPRYLHQLKTIVIPSYTMFPKFTESTYDNISFDNVGIKSQIYITADGRDCYMTSHIKIVYTDSRPNDAVFKAQFIQATEMALNSLRWDFIWTTRNNPHRPFGSAYNPIFVGEPQYEFLIPPNVMNIQRRTRRRAIQGIQALPQNVTNVIADFAVGPSMPNTEAIPPELSTETLLQPFEKRLARAEEARLEVARQASAAAVPVPEPKSWWKRMFGKGRRTYTYKRRTHARKTRGRRRA